MKKHKLQLDDLAIESFETIDADGEKGTVKGHDFSEAWSGCTGCPQSTALWSLCGTCRECEPENTGA